MKNSSTYLKIYFYFALFSIISNIHSFANIPLWNNKEFKDSLPEIISNAEIISISSDNSTSKILYLIKEDNESFFYINVEKYKINFEEELKYLTSPLIEYQDVYYFCSSLKNIIKLYPNGTLEKIENLQNNLNNFELKCFYLEKEKIIIVTYINTPYVYSYDLSISDWKTDNYSSDYGLNLGDKIFDTNLYNIHDINNIRFGFLFKEIDNYKFNLYQYNNFQFGPIHNIEFQDEFYSKTLCTFSKEKSVYIFTYEPKQINKYNFYFLDLGSIQYNKFKGNLYLNQFKEAEIFDAYFIENTPVLFYNIRKRELNGEYKFYIGVVDLESLVILYNIQFDSFKKIFYNFGFLYNNKGFLKYFENGQKIEICPFIYNYEGEICQFFINEDNYYSFEISEKYYENKIVEECKYGKIGKYCINECPIGFELVNNQCIECNKNFFYNYATKKCISSKNESYPIDGKIIFNCEEINLKYYKENCYNNCSEIYGIISPNESECISCKDQNKIYFESNCINSCHDIFGMVNPDNENECISCESKNKVYFDLNCYDNCSDIYGIINPKNNKECIICKNESKIFLDNKCVENCPEGYEIINDKLQNYEVSYCRKCQDVNKYYYDHKCYDKCPDKKLVFDSDNICFFCNVRNKNETYYQSGKCVSTCDNGYESIDDEFYCKYCKNENQYFAHNGKCEDSCEDKSLYYEDNNICYFSNETEKKYRQNDICVNSCERGYEQIEKDFFCQNCLNISQYFYEGKCEEKCPENLAWNDTDNICIDCYKELGLFFKENKCVNGCGGRMILENYICKKCGPENKFYYDYNCYETCPNYTVTDNVENYCYLCDTGKFQDGECVSECSDLYMENYTMVDKRNISICFKCGTDNKSWFKDHKCVADCNETSNFASEDHYCRLCFCGFSNYNCDKFSDKCECDKGEDFEIFGNNCEFWTEFKFKDKKLIIVPIGPSISTKKSFFTFDLVENAEKENKKIISIEWRFFLDNNEIKEDMKYFAAGVHEEIFVINSKLLQPDKENKITLDLITVDIKNSSCRNEFHDEIKISIQSLERQKGMQIYSSNNMNNVMDNTFKLDIEKNINVEQIKFYYKLLIKDEHNELIPIKKKDDLGELLSRTFDKNNPINFILPNYKEFIFELTNNREEQYNITQKSTRIEYSSIKYTFEEIIQRAPLQDHSEMEKIFLIMKYMDLNQNFVFSDENYKSLIKFIEDKIILVANEKLNYEDKEEIESNRYYINYIEPKTIFSLLNKIFLHQKQNIPEKYFRSFLNIFKTFWDTLTEKKNPGKYIEKLHSSDIISFFRTFDHFLDIYQNKPIIDKNNWINKQLIFEILNILTDYLVTDIYPGESIRLVGKRISLILSGFTKRQNNIAFSSVNDISKILNYEDYSSFSFDNYYLNQENCDDEGNTLLCIKPSEFKKIKENKLDKIDIEYFSIVFFTINNTGNNPQNENEGDALSLKLINKIEIKHKYPIKGIFYNIDFSLKDYLISDNIQELHIKNNIKKDYSNITCVPKHYLLNKDFYCFTYFNYDKDIINCNCNIFDEIAYVSNSTLANFYIDLQTKSILKTYNFMNKISLKLVFIVIIIILFPSCIYLLYDIINDEKQIDNNLLTYAEKIKKRFLQVKILSGSSIISFSFYATLFQFPYLSPLRICNYKNPKYIKHFIVILGIFYGFLLSLTSFYFLTPFKELKNIINERDIKNKYFELNNDILFKYILKGIIFAFIGVCITRIFIYIFGIILSFNKDEINYWKEMKTIFTNYISNEIKGNVLLGPTWNKIKTRMIAYINICGNYILNKIEKKNKINKKFENYLTTMEKNSECTSSTNKLLPNFDLEETINLDYDAINNNKLGNYRAPSIDSINSNKSKNKQAEKHYDLNVSTINNSFSKSSKRPESLNSKTSNLKVINSDNFQLYSLKIKKDKTITKKDKFERIKNKYIYTRKNKALYEIEIDSISESVSTSHEFYSQLVIDHEINLSYFPVEEFITNETLIYSDYNLNGNKIKLKIEGYNQLIIINIILFILLFLLVFAMFVFNKILLNHFGIFIIKVWLISTIVFYTIIYPLSYFIKNLIGSILLFKCYHLKNRAFYKKVLFRIFVNKTMIYIFKVRNYITKYEEELNY